MSEMTSPISSSPDQSSPSPVPRHAASADNAERLELEALMRLSPVPEIEQGDIEVFGGSRNPSVDNTLDQGGATTLFMNEQPPVTPHHPINFSLRNHCDRIERRASQLRLTPYQREMTQNFVKMDSVGREIELFVAMCALDNKLDKIVSTIPPFSVSPALLENIKSYCMSVLLSSKLGAYKGIVPCDHVIAIIKKQSRHLPSDFERDHHAQKELKAAVNYELTQARAELKKEIGKSLADNSTIFELANRVVAGTQCSITVPLSARLALLRKLMVTHNNQKYWDHIDAWLKLIRETAGGDQKKIDRAFSTYLQTDRQTYGIDNGYIINEGNDDHVQQAIDSVIMGATASSIGS